MRVESRPKKTASDSWGPASRLLIRIRAAGDNSATARSSAICSDGAQEVCPEAITGTRPAAARWTVCNTASFSVNDSAKISLDWHKAKRPET